MKGTKKITVADQAAVSSLTAHTVMVLQMERFMLLAQAASRKLPRRGDGNVEAGTQAGCNAFLPRRD